MTVLPKLYYAAAVVQAAPISYVDQTLLRVINFAAKMVYGLRKYDHATQSKRQLGWLDPVIELKYRTQLMAYKLFLEGSSIGSLAMEEARRSRRLNGVVNFKLPSFSTDASRRAFSYRAPMLLNNACQSLSLDCQSPIHLKNFKSLLRSLYDNLFA